MPTPTPTDSYRTDSKWGVGIAAACLAGIDILPLCASIGAVTGYVYPIAVALAMFAVGSSSAEGVKVASSLLGSWSPHSAMIGAAVGAAGGLCVGAFQAYHAIDDAIHDSLNISAAPQTFLQKLAERRNLIADELGFKTKNNTLH